MQSAVHPRPLHAPGESSPCSLWPLLGGRREGGGAVPCSLRNPKVWMKAGLPQLIGKRCSSHGQWEASTSEHPSPSFGKSLARKLAYTFTPAPCAKSTPSVQHDFAVSTGRIAEPRQLWEALLRKTWSPFLLNCSTEDWTKGGHLSSTSSWSVGAFYSLRQFLRAG